MEAGWNFDNSYATLPGSLYSRVRPTPVAAPRLVLLNVPLAEELGLDVEALRTDEGVAVLAGNRIPTGAEPLAQAYAGHQFGHFTMLGDGRAILLGEQIAPDGRRWDIQLKGAGRTPYSRGGDGRAALGPMLREFIISEAMHALGIPTTRSLAVVATGEEIVRERLLPGAILTRVAASHLRVGTFQYAAAGQTRDELRALAEYALQRHYPEVDGWGSERYLDFLRRVIERQASLVAQWQLVGFIHGVMNTDNTTISGETIDYGPCAFMDAYDPETVFSSIDRHGRYAYGNQPPIANWNLARFAEALLPLLHEEREKAVGLAQEAIEGFSDLYHRHWLNGMRAKLGLFSEEDEDSTLVEELLSLMHEHGADYTNTFRALTLDQTEELPMHGTGQWTQWYTRWQARLERQAKTRDDIRELMRNANPSVIPRNHRVEEALSAAVDGDDLSVVERFLTVLQTPFSYTQGNEAYAELPKPTGKPYRTFCGT